MIQAAVGPAQAADGCLVLLCLAAPNWRAIAPCVAPVKQVLRDLLKGKALPACSMSGAGNSATHQWANAPTFCPPQYTVVTPAESTPTYSCQFTGAVSVWVSGAPFARTWWSTNGDTVTEFTATAKAQLGNWDTRFDNDYLAWLAGLPPAPPSADVQGGF